MENETNKQRERKKNLVARITRYTRTICALNSKYYVVGSCDIFSRCPVCSFTINGPQHTPLQRCSVAQLIKNLWPLVVVVVVIVCWVARNYLTNGNIYPYCTTDYLMVLNHMASWRMYKYGISKRQIKWGENRPVWLRESRTMFHSQNTSDNPLLLHFSIWFLCKNGTHQPPPNDSISSDAIFSHSRSSSPTKSLYRTRSYIRNLRNNIQ